MPPLTTANLSIFCFRHARRNLQLFGTLGGILVDLIYLASILNLLRLIYKCAYTEPGICPAIPSKNSHAIRSQTAAQGIHVEYKTEAERPYDGDKNAYNFADNRFKHARIVDPNKETYNLSVCTTCMIVRPPRAFHCSICGVCIEAQDHHCPWMGTCIGKRNLKYFLSFLFLTALHAFVTAAICGVYFFKVTYTIDQFDSDRDMEKAFGLLSAGVGIYASMIGLTLICFALYSLSLMQDNITSNENLRTRWNAKHKNVKNSRRARLMGKANEDMTPEQLEEHSNLISDM